MLSDQLSPIVVVLDSEMSVAKVLSRLAKYGLWLDPQVPISREWITACARRLKLPAKKIEGLIRRDTGHTVVAIRRQASANILWYAYSAQLILQMLGNKPVETPLDIALFLFNSQPTPVYQLEDGFDILRSGLIFSGSQPVAFLTNVPSMPYENFSVDAFESFSLDSIDGFLESHTDPTFVEAGSDGASFDYDQLTSPTLDSSKPRPRTIEHAFSKSLLPEIEQPSTLSSWPFLDAPRYSPAGQAFQLVVGLGENQQAGVLGSLMQIPTTDSQTLNITVELVADGIKSTNGWSRPLQISLTNPYEARVTFTLIGDEPTTPNGFHLSFLEVRYVLNGYVCGTASLPMVIGPSTSAEIASDVKNGTYWADMPKTATSVALTPNNAIPDITIEILKPDGNISSGRYQCKIYSPHPLTTASGPFDIHLGDNAQSFAQELLPTQIKSVMSDLALNGIANTISDCLPSEVFEALDQIINIIQPSKPSILIISAEPYIPWELADFSVDDTLPAFLGAQTILGRWLYDSHQNSVRSKKTQSTITPPASLLIRKLEFMAGNYQDGGLLKPLPKATSEVSALSSRYKVSPLDATAENLEKFLLQNHSNMGIDACHIAGHGDITPNQLDGATLYLSDGTAVGPMHFRGAKFSPNQQPLLFLNACMIGTGSSVLGGSGGFPGACISTGFSGILGALWEVDDTDAHDIALDFWLRALPTDDSQQSECIGRILMDLRARYLNGGQTKKLTYLAYVFFGHPLLKLSRQRQS